MKTGVFLMAMLTAAAVVATKTNAQDKVLRVGIIGLDTSHVTAFTKILNDPKASGDLAGFKVVAAFRGGSPDVKASYSRLDKFTNSLRDTYGVEIVDSIDDLVKKVDVVLLESVDGRPHLQQVTPVLKAGKRVFIDKPIGGSLADVLMIFELSKKYKTPLFSSSSYRFGNSIRSIRTDKELGKVMGSIVYSSCEIEPHHPDFFWYGIHGVEGLFTIMGTGCTSVTRTHTKSTDVATGLWNDGRIGTYCGLRTRKTKDGAVIFGQEKTVTLPNAGSGYDPLVLEITKFFRTGQAPVAAEETIEMFAFMEAADESKRQGGVPVTIASVMEKARQQNQARKVD